MAKLQIFNGEIRKVLDFLTIYRLYIRMRRTDIVGVVIYIERISRYIEGEYNRIFGE